MDIIGCRGNFNVKPHFLSCDIRLSKPLRASDLASICPPVLPLRFLLPPPASFDCSTVYLSLQVFFHVSIKASFGRSAIDSSQRVEDSKT